MNRTRVYRSKSHNVLSVIAFSLLGLLSIAGIGLWRMHSVQLMTVESNSMMPAIRKGDAVALQSIHPTELKAGDVISYRSPADQSVVITHRVIQVQKTWNQIITQGDNTPRPDSPVPMSNILGKVTTRISYAGYVLNFLRTLPGLIVCVYLPAAVLLISELRNMAKHYSRPTYRLVR